MTTLCLTRNELIDDLPSAYREQNDIEAMSDKKLIVAWKNMGTHTGAWDWDDVEILEGV